MTDIIYSEIFGSESYYTKVFERFENGQYLCNLLNPRALFSGPLWYINRRVGRVWGLFCCYVFTFLSAMFIDELTILNASIMIAVTYLVLFVFPSNIIFYSSVKSFVGEQITNDRYDVDAVKQRFESGWTRGVRRWKAMQWG